MTGASAPQSSEPRLSRNLAITGELRRIGESRGRLPGEVAIAWTLRHSAVTGAIVGARSSEQVAGIIGAADFRLSPSEIEEISAFVAQHP